jgi:transposase
MGRDVRNGDVFIFIGSSRKLVKLLHAEDGGMVMYVKRLEAGRFRLPEYNAESRTYNMEWRDLVLMVEGIKEDPEQRLRRLKAERNEYVV